MKKFFLSIFLLSMFALLLAGCGSNAPTSNDDLGQAPPQAVKLVQEKLGDKKLALEYYGTEKEGISLGTKDGNMNFTVMPDFKGFVFVQLKNVNFDLGKKNVKAEEARQSAANYAKKFYPDLDKLQPSSGEGINTDGIGEFTWQLNEKGVQLPTGVKMTIDAKNGKVKSFELRNFTLNINLTPSITKEKATEIAFREVLSPKAKPSVSNMELFGGSFGGQERLLWSISLVVYEPQKAGKHLIYSQEIYMDAHTGKIIRSSSEKESLVTPTNVANSYLAAIKDKDWETAYYETRDISANAPGYKNLNEFKHDEEANGFNSAKAGGYRLDSYRVSGENISDDGHTAYVNVTLKVTRNGKQQTINETWSLTKVKGEWRLSWNLKE